MKEETTNPNFKLAKVCESLYEKTGNYGYDNLSIALSMSNDLFEMVFPLKDCVQESDFPVQ